MTDIVRTVLRHAEAAPDRPAFHTFTRRGQPASRSFSQLATDAGRAASFYHQHGLRRGDVVVFLGTHHADLPACWLGCVWLGAVPTVLAEPTVRIDREIYWSRLGELFARIGAWGVVFDPKLFAHRERMALAHSYSYPAVVDGHGEPPAPVAPRPDDTLLLQHSSGTTGLHKGVMLSHGAIERHAASYARPLGIRPDDIIASWLPLYHDMGFIACFVDALLYGVPVVWLSPFEWVANPALWLDAITEYRATLAWLPNFAFAFLAARVKTEPNRYNLASVRALINCSEPVNAESMQLFCNRFAADGFDPAALQTCYAMAENVFAVSTSSADCPPKIRTIERAPWHAEHRAVACPPASTGGIVHVSNGVPVDGCEVRIVDAQGAPCPPNRAGQIQIRSPFLFSGYFRASERDYDLFAADGYFNTADLGYLDDDGHVYVTGRAKDLIIVGGKNIYPQDVEQSACEVAGVYPGRAVAFGVRLHSAGTEGLVVLAESEQPADDWPDLAQTIRSAIPARMDVDVFDVRIVARMSLRKSTSGKLARTGNREWYLAGQFGPISDDIESEV